MAPLPSEKRIGVEANDAEDDRLTAAVPERVEGLSTARTETATIGRCTRTVLYIRSNPRCALSILVFFVGIAVMAVYVDAIVQQRACFFLKPPYKNYRITATDPHSCDNLLSAADYHSPLDATLINHHPNTTYNVVMFGDSMVAYSMEGFNLTGRVKDFLPQYANNLRFFNQGHHPSSYIITHHHPSSPISSINTHHHPSSPISSIITHHHPSSPISVSPIHLCATCVTYKQPFCRNYTAPSFPPLLHRPSTTPSLVFTVYVVCCMLSVVYGCMVVLALVPVVVAGDEYRYRSGSLP